MTGVSLVPFEVNMSRLLALLVVLISISKGCADNSGLPPEIAKCCSDDSTKECKIIDAAAGYGGHYYTWFGEYYAKTGIDSEGRPVGISGYPKKTVGTGSDSWFKPTEATIGRGNPITTALNNLNCLLVVYKKEKYCFQIVNDVISRVGDKGPFFSQKTVTACMLTMFNLKEKWFWFWEKVYPDVWWLKIREGKIKVKDKIVTEDKVPQAVAGLTDGDKYKGLFFAKSGLVYPFVLTDSQVDLNVDEMFKKAGFKASLFMGCANKAVTASTDTTLSIVASTAAPDVSKSTKPRGESKILFIFVILVAIFIFVVLVIGLILGAIWYVKRNNKKKMVEKIVTAKRRPTDSSDTSVSITERRDSGGSYRSNRSNSRSNYR